MVLRAVDCDTPALLLDMDAAERNIKRMAAYFRGTSASLRPHVKVHKSPWLAQKQIDAGAKGITVAKVSEAEVMASAGIDDVLIAGDRPEAVECIAVRDRAARPQTREVFVHTVEGLGQRRIVIGSARRHGAFHGHALL